MARSGRPGHEKIPREIRDLFGELWQQVASLHFSWAALTQLFNGDPQRIRVLRETAPTFFGLARHAFQNTVVLSISRLTDPEGTGPYRNASLAALVSAAQPLVSEDFASRLCQDLKRVSAHAKPIRRRRNKVLAHLDRQTALSTDPNPLPGITRDEFEAVLETIRGLMNAVEGYFADSTTDYDTPVSHGDADHLVFYLEQALKAEDEERKRHGLPPR